MRVNKIIDGLLRKPSERGRSSLFYGRFKIIIVPDVKRTALADKLKTSIPLVLLRVPLVFYFPFL